MRVSLIEQDTLSGLAMRIAFKMRSITLYVEDKEFKRLVKLKTHLGWTWQQLLLEWNERIH